MLWLQGPQAHTPAGPGAASDHQALQQQLIDALQRAQSASDKQQQLQQQLEAALSEADEARLQQEQLQQQLEEEAGERQQLVAEQEQLLQQLQGLQEEHQGLQQQVGVLQEQQQMLEVAREQQQQLEEQLRELEHQLEASRREREELQQRVEAAAAAANAVNAIESNHQQDCQGDEQQQQKQQGKKMPPADADSLRKGDGEDCGTPDAVVTPRGRSHGSAAGVGEGGVVVDGSPAEHAVRAELRVSQAEVARLRHELDVKRSSADQQLHLAQKEILRLQGILPASDGVTGDDCGEDQMGGKGGAGDLREPLDQQGRSAVGFKQQDEVEVGWALVVENPAFLAEPLVLPGGGKLQQQQEREREGVAASWYEQRVADMEDTIGSLRQQLKLQEQTVAALQRRTGQRVRRGRVAGISHVAWILG